MFLLWQLYLYFFSSDLRFLLTCPGDVFVFGPQNKKILIYYLNGNYDESIYSNAT